MLRLAGSGQDGLGVAFEDCEPGSDVDGMVGTRLRAMPQVHGEEGCTELGDQLFKGVSCVTETTIQGTVEAVLGPGPMNQLVCQDCVVAFEITKLRLLGEPDLIDAGRVIGPVAAVADLHAGPADELGGGGDGFGLGQNTLRQGLGAFDLVAVENGVNTGNQAARASASVFIVIRT